MKRINSSFGLLAMAIVGLSLVGCTKHKDLKNMVGNAPYIAKADLDGKTFSLVRGIEEADSDNQVGAVPGTSEDFGLVRAKITENELQLIRVFDPQGRDATASIMASFPIVDQFDIKREENDFKEQTHRIVEDRQASWQDRKFVRINWSAPSNTLSRFTRDVRDSSASEENVTLLEAPKVEDGHISWLVETSLQAKSKWKWLAWDDWAPVTGARVTYRTHLMPLKSTDYQPISYSPEDFAKFGYFMTQQNWEDPIKGLLDSNVKTYAHAFNVCEPSVKRSCATNKVIWHLNKGFPEKYVKASVLAVEQWNLALQKALGRTDKVVDIDLSKRVDRVDPRYNVIHLYEPDSVGGYGIAQWASNPMTGELIGVRATVYGAAMRDMAGLVDRVIDLAASEPAVVKAMLLGRASTSKQMYGKASELNAGKRFSKVQTELRRTLGMDKLKISNPPSLRVAAKAIAPVIRASPEQATASIRALMRNAPQVFALEEVSKINGLAPLAQLREDSPTNSERMAKESFAGLNGVESLMLIGESRREEKKALLYQAEHGLHGAELVEEAVLNYLMKLVSAKAPKELLAQREQIKAIVEQRVYFMILLHEMGHTFGLRHNFEGSVDEANYVPQYFAKLEEVKAGKASELELEPFKYSSVMEYVSDFHVWDGGVGPYDIAAIRYAYNRSLNKATDPIVSRKYRFCTDHEVGEQMLCNRFDKGRNLSEITLNRIANYKRDYVLTHFRRDRARFDRAARGVHGWALNTMLPVRQVMDEFIFKLINDKEVDTPTNEMGSNVCDKKWMSESVKRGEIANFCDRMDLEGHGVDPMDLSTLFRALIDPRSGGLKKSPSSYTPEGLADLVFANSIAQEFFQDVIGATEPGTFVVVPNKDGGKDLVRLPEGGDDHAKLMALAKQQNLPADQVDAIVKASLGSVTDVTVFDSGRYFSSAYEERGKTERLTRVGYSIDKMAAISILAARDLGVWKYDRINMSGNPYTYPHTKRFVNQIFEKLITSAEVITQIPVKTRSGATVLAQAPASTGRDTQLMSTVLALTSLVFDSSNTGMLDRLRVCVEGESGCAGNQIAEFTSASGQQKFRAAQLPGSDSIAFTLVSEAAAIDKERQQWVQRAERAPKAKAEFIAKAKQTIVELTAIDEKYFANSPELTEYRNILTNPDQNSGSVLATLVVMSNDGTEIPPFTLSQVGDSIEARIAHSIGKIEAVLQGSICKDAKKKEVSCTAAENPTSRAALVELKQKLPAIQKGLSDSIQNQFISSLAPALVERKTAELAGKEANILWIRKINNLVGNR